MAEAQVARLISGGDHRLALQNGLNTYGCPPLPDEGMAALGSCTGSPISAAALQAITPLDTALEQGGRARAHWPALLADWLNACGLPPTTGISPSASGTDLHGEFVAGMHQRHPDRPLHIISFAPNETGRGVPAQLAQAESVVYVALRDTEGRARSLEAIDADYQQAIADARAQHGHCVVITSDVSKTGLQAPSLALTAHLIHAQATGDLTVLIDACQFRCTPDTLRTYVQSGAWVALTGSKFFSGPSFSGFLLHEHQTLGDPAPENPGLLLRSAAALFELQRFLSLPEATLTFALEAFAHTVTLAFQDCRALQLIPQPALTRMQPGWDTVQSIFVFQIVKAGQPASLETHQQFRQRFYTPGLEPRIFLGQAVELAPGQPALRLCSSSRWVVDAVHQGLDLACAELGEHVCHLDRQAVLTVTG